MSGVSDDLATLRHRVEAAKARGAALYVGGDYEVEHQEGLAALARVEAELARLHEAAEFAGVPAWTRLHDRAVAAEARAVAAEARCARLQHALGAYRSALRSGEPESERMRQMGDEALAGPDTPADRFRGRGHCECEARGLSEQDECLYNDPCLVADSQREGV